MRLRERGQVVTRLGQSESVVRPATRPRRPRRGGGRRGSRSASTRARSSGSRAVGGEASDGVGELPLAAPQVEQAESMLDLGEALGPSALAAAVS